MDILKSLGHPEEIFNLFKFKMGGCRTVMPKLDYVSKHFLLHENTYLNKLDKLDKLVTMYTEDMG